jgi:hypothetical protein
MEMEQLLEEKELDPKYLKVFESYEDVLTIGDISRMLRIDQKKVQKLIRAGAIKSIHYDRSVRVAKIWVLEYLQENEERAVETIHQERMACVLAFCKKPRSCAEIQRHLGMVDKSHCRRTLLAPLLAEGKLAYTIPDTPNHIRQKYIAVKPTVME